MSSQQLRIQMAGEGPFGFRFLGGDKSPLFVSKIRPSSKAHVAGMLGGDVLLAINDINCHGLSHDTATGLVESSNAGLTVLVLRGKEAISDAPSVMASSLDPSIRRLSDEEAVALAQRHPAQAPSASYDSAAAGGGTFRLSAPPSGESLKQIRVSRRESRSEDVPTPRIAVEEPVDRSDFYAREEKTSTDGGRTTHVVEEVKTEKFGGTTLTKVTKQEFTSYGESSPSFPGMPTRSVPGSEGPGHPMGLGAPAFEGDGNPTKDAQQLPDERGWGKTQPFEGHVIVAQDPRSGWAVYQDGIGGEPLARQGQAGNQAVPAIEIRFRPDETGFAKAILIQPTSKTDSNLKTGTGSEVVLQPEVQVQSAWTRDRVELEPVPNVQTYQKPRIEVEPEHPQVPLTNNPENPVESRSHIREPQVSYQTHGNSAQDYYKQKPSPDPVYGYKQQPTATTGNPRLGYHPESEIEYTATVHHPNQVPRYETDRTQAPNPIGRDADAQYASGQYGYDTTQVPGHKPDGYTEAGYQVQPKLYTDHGPRLAFGQDAEGHSRSLYDTPHPPPPPPPHHPHSPHSQYGSFNAPVQHQQQQGYETQPQARTPSHPKQTVPAYQDEPILPQRLPGTKDLQTLKVSLKEPARGFPESDGPIVPKQLGGPEADEIFGGHRPTRPGSGGGPNFRLQDRAEIGPAPYQIPGYNLPMQPPVHAREPRGPLAGDLRSNPELHRGQIRRGEGDDRRANEYGWYEVPAGWYEVPAAADTRSLPEVPQSRMYDPRELENESWRRSLAEDADYEYRGPAFPHHRPSDWSARGHTAGQTGQQQHQHHQAPKNAWRPSSEVYGSNLPGPAEAYGEDWRSSRGARDSATYGPRSDFRYQPETAVGGHPYMPAMMTGPSAPPQEPRAPPPPAPPPIDHLKVYRGVGPSDRDYGSTSLEERVKAANFMAHSVLAPENKNSRGQKLFLRRRENAHKWTREGPDPVPERPPPQPRPDPNAWAQSAHPPSVYQDGRGVPVAGTSMDSGQGGHLFAKRDNWMAYESPGIQPVHPLFAGQGAYGVEGPTGGKYGPTAPYAVEQRGGPGAGAARQTPWYQQSTLGGLSSSQGPQRPGFASDYTPQTPQGYRPIRFHGAPAFSSSAQAAPSYGQPARQQPAKFAPKQLGFKASVGPGAGYVDL